MKKSWSVRFIELNGTFYECAEELAELLEWLRLEQVRVKVYKFMRPKPLTGYIKRRPRSVHNGLAARPLVVYNKRSEIGRWLDEDIITEIRFSNRSMGEEPIWTMKEGVKIEFELPLKQVGDA